MNDKAFEVTPRSVFAIVVPVTIASMTTPLIGITDMAVIGRLGDAALLGGLAIGAILFDLIFTSLNFLRSGTTGLTAQALGAQNTAEQHAVLNRALLLSVIIGVILVLFAKPMLQFGLYVMQASPEVAAAVSAYFVIRILSAPLTLLNYTILGWLLGLGLARRSLVLQLVANGINIVLSIYLGLIKGYGIEGVAWATVISELAACILGFYFVRLHAGHFVWGSWQALLNKQKIKRTLSLNSDIIIRSFILLFAFSFFTAQGSRMGDITLAANAILMNFFLLSAFILDGFATATEQLVGKAIGARYLPAFNKTVRISLIWSAILSALIFCFLMLFGPTIIAWLTTNLAVQKEANIYLIWAALTGVFGVLAFQMDGVFIGATWSKDMRNMMIISLAVYFLAWWLFTPLWHNHGLWLSLEV
ncbi:MAG: MATE family efflux transporter, partial [Arenicellales bacterium]